MQALERGFISNDWITLLFVFVLLLFFALKTLNINLLFGYFFSFFKKGFIEKRAEENPSFFSAFHITLFLVSSVIFSLFVVLTVNDFSIYKVDGFSSFWQLFLLILLYLIVKYALDFLLSRLFRISVATRYFLFTKYGYFYTVNLWMFPVLILYTFSFKNEWFLLISFSILIMIRFLFIVGNNKNLILSKLFYFILYLCALEIAPLFILYKLMIK